MRVFILGFLSCAIGSFLHLCRRLFFLACGVFCFFLLIVFVYCFSVFDLLFCILFFVFGWCFPLLCCLLLVSFLLFHSSFCFDLCCCFLCFFEWFCFVDGDPSPKVFVFSYPYAFLLRTNHCKSLFPCLAESSPEDGFGSALLSLMFFSGAMVAK